MELNIKYQVHNGLRFCQFDNCWVREIQMDGVWFCFYSKFRERLTDTMMNTRLSELKKARFTDNIGDTLKHQPKEYRGYIHLCWTDHLPKSGGFMGLQNPPSFWRVVMMKPVDDSQIPAVYEVI